jgi:hypothetical protein
MKIVLGCVFMLFERAAGAAAASSYGVALPGSVASRGEGCTAQLLHGFELVESLSACSSGASDCWLAWLFVSCLIAVVMHALLGSVYAECACKADICASSVECCSVEGCARGFRASPFSSGSSRLIWLDRQQSLLTPC